ncbi:unnamed protein product [Symbiodinium microadriaticum]|nr:unnamed protein product [Symbiodinium microadriaticum]
MDHYVTTKMLKVSWRSPALWIRELHVLEGDVNASAGATPFLACRHQGLPKACHDRLVDEGSKVRVDYCYQSQTAPPTPKTTCHLIPWTVAQLPNVGPESPNRGRWQLVTWLCNASEYAETLATQLQRLGEGRESEQRMAFDVVLYSACGAAGARAALHHVHGLLLAIQADSTATVPEGVVLIRGDMVNAGTFPEKLLDVLVQQPKAQLPRKRLTIFEGTVGQGACGYCGGFGVVFTWHCPLHSLRPSMRGCPQAAAFTTTSLLSASSSEWAVASTMDLKEATEQFDVLVALLVKALQDANASDATVLDQTLSLEDPFAVCLEAFVAQRFLEKTGMPPYYVYDFKLQALDCFAHGGAYATVETGLKSWLASPRNGVQEEEAVRQELKKMGLDAMSFLEVFGVCVPDLCRHNITAVAWHYVMDHQMFRSSFWQVPPVPSRARIRRFFRNRTFFAPDA